MDYTDALSQTLDQESESGTLSRSEEVYLEFRRTIEPGLFDVGFDMTPAKSSPFGYTDQTHRSHILNGAAFAARLNRALKRLDEAAALDDTELAQAFALFAVHDLHKTPDAQRRRARETDRAAADKDITDAEVQTYVEALGLTDVAPGLTDADFVAAALGTESESGRHRGATSRSFTHLRPWLRLMDAAASTADPTEAASLQGRLDAISSEVAFGHHYLNDTKGITTNFLTSTVADVVANETAAVPLVYFVDGAIYLHPAEADPLAALPDEDALGTRLTDGFIDTVREKVGEASTLEDTRQTLVDKLNYGFMEFSRPTYLLYGFERADEALQADLADRMSGEPTLYSQYRLGAIGARGAGLVESFPSDWRTGQAATVYVATLFSEIFDPLVGGDTGRAVETIGEALGVPETAEWLTDLPDWEWEPAGSVDAVEDVATHLDMDPEAVHEEADGGIHLRRVKRFAAVLALAYIEDGADGSLAGLSTEGVLQQLSDRLESHFRAWDEQWDTHRGRGWNDEQPATEKAEVFLRQKTGTVRDAIQQYITDTVVIFSQGLTDGPTGKTKLGQYANDSQPHICLLCNSVLTGSRSKADFETSEDTVGLSMRFSHLSEITAEGGEPDALACPLCELEMVIRNSVHDFGDESADFLFLAPDYFHAPADIAFQRTVSEYLFASNGYNLFQMAKQLIDAPPSDRSSAASAVLSVLSPDEDAESFQNTLKNYDAAFSDVGSLGVFRLDPPRRDTGSRDPVTRVPRAILNLATATTLSWLTSSRVLLTGRPVPVTRFAEVNEMVTAVDLPPQVQSMLGDSASMAYLWDLDETDTPAEMPMYLTRTITAAETADGDGDDAAGSPATDAADPGDADDEETVRETEQYHLTPRTQFAERLYHLSGLLTVTFRAHGQEVQRLSSTISALQSPFAGATALLKGTDVQADTSALNAAQVLDTLTNKQMSNSIADLAAAGFDTVRPEFDRNSNYNYERLFRVARDAISDDLMQNADPAELETIVAGQVMKAATRAETNAEFSEEYIKQDAAEQFAEVFVDEIVYGICDGDFYKLRRHENSLAAGYNAAIRRHQQDSFTDDDSDDAADSDTTAE